MSTSDRIISASIDHVESPNQVKLNKHAKAIEVTEGDDKKASD
jgi:hypothetical protein